LNQDEKLEPTEEGRS